MGGSGCILLAKISSYAGMPSMDKPGTLAIVTTTVCNANCQHCFCKGALHNWEYGISDLRSHLTIYGDVYRIHLSGGEPTMHSKFKDLVSECRLHCRYLTMESNASCKDYSLYSLVDRVYISKYEFNVHNVSSLTKYLEDNRIHYFVGKVSHIHGVSGNVGQCERYNASWSLYNGYIYPCCVSWCLGEDGGTRVENFKQGLKSPACVKCVFSK